MTISQQNIIKRWNIMANADLGYEVQPIANAFARFFQKAFSIDGDYIQINTEDTVNRVVNGINFNHRLYDTIVCTTLDLSHITTTKMDVEEIDWYLMEYMGWDIRYQYALAN